MTERQRNQRARLRQRNLEVENEFKRITRKEPKWRHSEHVKYVAERFHLSTRTVEAILNGEYDKRIFTDRSQLNLFGNNKKA